MRLFRPRTDQPRATRSRPAARLETLEGRALLSGYRNPTWAFDPSLYRQFYGSDLPITNPITNQQLPYSVIHSVGHNPLPNNPNFGNEGKLISGKDRAGNEWAITVHGPGYAIVTDITPNDGVLADDIDTIQLIGTDINSTYVTGNVVTSFRQLDDSTIDFNRLIATTGVHSITLNGFTLAQTVYPGDGLPNNQNTGIFLTGGVRSLSFHNVNAPIDRATNDFPINIVIGDPSTPLDVQPSIHIDHIFNTVFDSSSTDVPANVPLTSPTVSIIVNGEIKRLDLASVTQQTVDAGQQYAFPVVGTTGRTSIQTTGIGELRVGGRAVNLTASRSATPFQSGFTSLSHIGTARFGGPTDAVGLDVSGGPIHRLQYDRGMGNPAGVFVAQVDGSDIPSTQYGVPQDRYGYGAFGYLGGQVVASNIDRVGIGPGNLRLQTLTNPDYIQLYRKGNTAYFTRPGTAMVNSIITTTGDIGHVNVVGQVQNSEIKTGFDYNSFAAGLEGTRQASRLGPVHVRGDLTNGVLSSTYRPFRNFYGTPLDVAGPGSITGSFNGVTTTTNGITPLTNVGAGFFARVKDGGYLPPPQVGDFAHGRRIRGA